MIGSPVAAAYDRHSCHSSVTSCNIGSTCMLTRCSTVVAPLPLPFPFPPPSRSSPFPPLPSLHAPARRTAFTPPFPSLSPLPFPPSPLAALTSTAYGFHTPLPLPLAPPPPTSLHAPARLSQPRPWHAAPCLASGCCHQPGLEAGVAAPLLLQAPTSLNCAMREDRPTDERPWSRASLRPPRRVGETVF